MFKPAKEKAKRFNYPNYWVNTIFKSGFCLYFYPKHSTLGYENPFYDEGVFLIRQI